MEVAKEGCAGSLQKTAMRAGACSVVGRRDAGIADWKRSTTPLVKASKVIDTKRLANSGGQRWRTRATRFAAASPLKEMASIR